MSDPLLAQVAKRLARPVGEGERKRARLHLLDWLACIAGARRSPMMDVARNGGLPPAERAALLGNILEMDDIHRRAILHPGPVIWAAAMGGPARSMEALLDAAVRGYEAMISVGGRLDGHHYSLWHPTATMGGMGSAASVSSLLGLDAERTGWALGNAGSVAGGLWHMRHDDVLTKQWHVLHAVRTGRGAAELAGAGLTGPAALLEGLQGLFAAFTLNGGEPAQPDDSWRIHEVSFKPWASCRHTHPAIDCAMELRAAGRLDPPFEVETFADALRFCDRPEPTTELEAKFSLQHAIAVVADGRAAEAADFTPRAISQLAAQRRHVTVREDPAITGRYPAHFGARVNGFELIDARGDPERPVGEEILLAKLGSLVAWGGLGPEEAPRAAKLSLEDNDPQALGRLLEDWLA